MQVNSIQSNNYRPNFQAKVGVDLTRLLEKYPTLYKRSFNKKFPNMTEDQFVKKVSDFKESIKDVANGRIIEIGTAKMDGKDKFMLRLQAKNAKYAENVRITNTPSAFVKSDLVEEFFNITANDLAFADRKISQGF